ncbi:helix-turn-helix domain-containing protein [Sphingomonas sp. CCH9-F2]|uniref:helix-turn-helix domain-containing protein n=1 Tax=Sphingomonas sp. CCH9-F2 TaxID=1768778 RepID=UPI0018D21E7C|nr:helix-turn-helix domain-containing protein [Sphingomonas sp. CCH9-F2]
MSDYVHHRKRKLRLNRPLDPNLFTRAEAAIYIGVSISALAHWACHGRGPVHHIIGKSSFYHRADLDAWIASRAGLPRGAN